MLTKGVVGVAEVVVQGSTGRLHQVLGAVALCPQEQHHHIWCGQRSARCIAAACCVTTGAQEAGWEAQVVQISTNHGSLVEAVLGVGPDQLAGPGNLHRGDGRQDCHTAALDTVIITSLQ